MLSAQPVNRYENRKMLFNLKHEFPLGFKPNMFRFCSQMLSH